MKIKQITNKQDILFSWRNIEQRITPTTDKNMDRRTLGEWSIICPISARTKVIDVSSRTKELRQDRRNNF